MNSSNEILDLAENIDLSLLIPSPEAIECLSVSHARRLQVLPIAIRTQGSCHTLIVACANSADEANSERIAKHVDKQFHLHLLSCRAELLQSTIEECYTRLSSFQHMLSSLHAAQGSIYRVTDGDEFALMFVNAVLLVAVRMRASDIHLSPDSDLLTIRLRIDGVLIDYANINILVLNKLLVRLKIMSSLDIAETRYAQDGQFSRVVDGYRVDFRISTFPTVDGENTVIRLIDPKVQIASLAALDMPHSVMRQLSTCMSRPEGLILVCGPTGAGKSTTLFALLAEVDKSCLSIMTLEDPVEHRIRGIRQTSIDASRQWGFADGLRAMLRQDPDILMVGEIRDVDSCSMALRAVSTGHQVLTTVHAACAHSALHRLREFKAADGALALSLRAIVAQRLVRRCCNQCKRQGDPCKQCHGSGYFGRQIVPEILEISPSISAMLAAGADINSIRHESASSGFIGMHEHASALIEAGVTTAWTIHERIW
jgi:general secretion pathway protein E/type IV pilus assembly protein PilB